MKSNAPWSVKGIERDARDAAKAAAQREGLTVGEWLNQIIYTAGDPNAAPTEGEIEGLKARDLAAAIEHLSRRIASAEAKSAAAVEHLARSLGGAVERLQRIERAEPVVGDGESLGARIKALEEKSGDRQRIEALRALERAVGQIAVQFNNAQQTTLTRLDQTERQLQEIAARYDANPDGRAVSAGAVRDAIEGMAARIERAEKIAAEATQLRTEAGESSDADFVQKTGIRLRILGDEIKRGGDQIRTLETTIARLSQQIDAAERRSAEGVQKVAETITDLREQFSNADATDQASARAEIEAAVSEITQRTEDRIQTLQESFDAMVRRLETAGRAAPTEPVRQPAAAFAAAPSPAQSRVVEEIDSELDDAFAALDLEESIPAQALPEAKAAPIEATAPAPVEDEFGFEVDEAPAADSDSETDAVLAEIREAFGIDPPSAPKIQAEAAEDGSPEASLDDALDLPPFAEAESPDADAGRDADFLKAARRAAREAAAKAAADAAQAGSPKKKLTPKQRAVLAARIKRRKEEEAADAAVSADAPPIGERQAAEPAAVPSVKGRVAALLAKMKAKGTAKAPESPDEDDIGAATKPAADPSIFASVTKAFGKVKTIPNAGGVAGLGAAIALLLVALFLMSKDKVGRAEKPTRRPAVAEAVAPPLAAQPADERLAPGAAPDATIRPRDLYLDNIAALKSATTDGEARVALKRVEESAALGHPPAQLQIGELYKLGQLYERDLGQARQWFERAANGGNVLAMHRLGVMAARGEGGPVDPAASIKWFEMAASFGLVDSQYNLGATYHPTAEGAAGGVQDRARAYFWYSIAANNGDAQAGEMAAGLASSMPAGEKSAKDAEVAAWAPKTPDPLANELAPAS